MKTSGHYDCERQNAVANASTTETAHDLDDRVRQFVAALPLATLAPVSTSQQHFGGGPMIAEPMTLTLPSTAIESVAWWMETSSATSLFIRPAYQALLVLALAFLENTEVRYKVEITGARGVGKTAFLSWVVYYLRAQTSSPPPAIVLDLTNGNDSFFGLIHANGSVERGQRGESFQCELAMRSTFYVYDAGSSLRPQSGDVLAKTIMLMPPTKNHCVDQNGHARPMETMHFVMPLWTLDELDVCRSCCYPRVSMLDLQELHKLWGGVPKWTLAERKDASTAHFRKCLDALTFADAAETIQARGWFDADAEESDRKKGVLGYDLIHVHADYDNTFQFRNAELCSSIACAVLLGASDKQEIRAFLDKYRGRGATAMHQFYVQVEHEYWKKLVMI
uniref:Uncharacterized protein n=1 Tax=Globisporangium ultimum (strain ATCC 200006 / CBS 805.95 / DAOM BR144) TaxID=431595 RepID=K3WSD8_GLOUD